MIRKLFLIQMLLTFSGLLLGANPAWSAPVGITIVDEAQHPPSFTPPGGLVTHKTRILCVELFTQKLLDCHFTLQAVGVIDKGGHDHGDHPLFEPNDAGFQYSCPLCKPFGPNGVEGQTNESEVFIVHPLPQASGTLRTEMFVDAPPFWHCAWACYTRTSWRILTTLDVGVQGLTPLSDAGPYHVVIRGGTSTHPDGTRGTPFTIEKLEKIAEEYFDRTDGIQLSINDLSLPKGGLFDLNNAWDAARGHREHRIGTDADLNRAGINCGDNIKLREAVEIIANGGPRPRLQCETNGRPDPNGPFYHIDFD